MNVHIFTSISRVDGHGRTVYIVIIREAGMQSKSYSK